MICGANDIGAKRQKRVYLRRHIRIKKLQQAIKLLEAEYNRARKCEFVNNPIAYALYHTWKKREEANQ